MIETETAGTCPPPSQTPVRTWISSSTRGAASDTASRFNGDGVRYKAKLIGVDPVPDAQGDKMCWDSMMKLKGLEAAARKQGKHKQRVWLKVWSGGLRMLDERSGAVLHDHDRSRISSWTRDQSDPRALAYVYQLQDAYCLFYIKTANLADPVLVDIRDVCQIVDQETPQEPAEAPAPTSSLLLVNDSPAASVEGAALEDLFSPRQDSSSGQSNQASSTNELMEVFSVQMEAPLTPNHIQSSSTSQPESPQQTLSTSQILSMFSSQPGGGSPYASPPYSPTTLPWGQQGLLGNQWAGQATAPWPTMPGGMAAWPPAAGMAAPPAGGQIQAPGVMMGGNMAAPPAAVGAAAPLNSFSAPAGGAGLLQEASSSLDQNLLL
ncbi:disabled homolog 2-like [Centropristis striata]|uniref:disabled homolog 2-like n=1 Tax=Centropristis striata TaxID=184440 RepID=UPI0027E016B3|nr:disabled homolog 2-like [Centropristis striata]